MTAHLLGRGQRQLAARLGPAGPPGRGGVPRDDRAGAGLPSRRGRVHLRRHRGRQPRPQGHLLVARTAPTRAAPASSRPRSSTTPCSTRCTGSAENAEAEVELLPVDREGRLDVAALRASIERDPASVALVSVMWANNEVGTLQPIDEVVALAAEHGIPVHTDAVQAVGSVPVDFATSGVDALTLTGHKVGGPFGVGALVVRREVAVTALLHGGGQERDIRSGTIDTPAIAGLAAAVELSVKHQAEHAARVGALRDDLVRRVLEAVPDAHLHGAPARAGRLPGNAHLGVPRLRGRLPAHAPRRPRHRVLDRLGLLGRRPAALARAAGHGLQRRGRAALAALLAGAHLHAGRRRRRRRGDRARRRARAATMTARRRGGLGGGDEGARRHVRGRRLGRRRRARGRGRATTSPASTSRSRATRSPTAAAPAAAARSRTATTPGAPPT